MRRIILAIALLVFLISGGYLGNILWERYDARQQNADIQKSVGVPLGADGTIGSYQPLSREALDKLKKQNPDFIAWITMPGTNINYPVVQGKTNNEYLHTTFDGKSRTAGTLFIDELNNADFSDFNSIVYGHHMRDKTMFQNLTLLREKKNFKRLRTVYVQLYSGDVLKYETSAVYLCHSDYDYRTIQYATREETTDFCERISEKSSFKPPTALTADDKILTLSTCEYDYTDGRLAVHARLLSQTPLENWK